jgi:RNA polymerase II subunit A C-terminal domain phosphatase SSU72
MLLDRNRRIKAYPQRFQDSTDPYDIVITCEERCFDLVCEELSHRTITLNRPVHVINFDIKDNPDDATVGARAILVLAQQLADSQDLDAEIEGILDEFVTTKAAHPIMYSAQYY